MPVQHLRLAPTRYCGQGAVANSTASVNNSTNALEDIDSSTYASTYGPIGIESNGGYAVFEIPLWSRIPSNFTVDSIDCLIKFRARKARKRLSISLGKIVKTPYDGFPGMYLESYEEVISLQSETHKITAIQTVNLGTIYNRTDTASWETNFADNLYPDNVYIGLKTNSSSSMEAFYIYGIELDVTITENQNPPKTTVKVKDKWAEIEKGYLKTADGWLERNLHEILVPGGKYIKGD